MTLSSIRSGSPLRNRAVVGPLRVGAGSDRFERLLFADKGLLSVSTITPGYDLVRNEPTRSRGPRGEVGPRCRIKNPQTSGYSAKRRPNKSSNLRA